MGFRSVGITEHTGVSIPQWFVDKWKDQLNIPVYDEATWPHMPNAWGKAHPPISYKWERKWHDDIIEDLQKVVAEDKEWPGNSLDMVVLHESGEVTKLEIFADKVKYFVAEAWEEVEDMHFFY